MKAGAAAVAAYAGWRYVDNTYHISNDVRYAKKLVPLKKALEQAQAEGMNISDLWRKSVEKWGQNESIVYEDRVYTYNQVDTASNKVANWATSRGISRGDTVALFMENRPEFIITWLGFAKIGVQVAMINTSIRKRGLLHCVKISKCKMLFFGVELSESVLGLDMSELNDVQFACQGGDPHIPAAVVVDGDIAAASTDSPSAAITKDIGMNDVFGYIYTSGTTGLPKAAIIKHSKMVTFGAFVVHGCDLKVGDRNYCVLPLFHSAGGGLGVGMMIYGGVTIIIKRKFSASSFWADCIKYKATVTQYIGELARYLLASPASALDKKHQVRIALGNGLRPEVWDEFQERFNIAEIGEFYGATEGNGALLNHCVEPGDRGAVGRQGWLLKKMMGHRIVKFNVVEEEPVRGSDGFCIECGIDEPGEMLFPIKQEDPTTHFVGYKDNKEGTAKKIAVDVFVKGDKYFRTGDLLKKDSRGFIHFVDRIGDTFRWKGENCSTTEVTEVMSIFKNVEECNVYGVQIPNNADGRAPMCAITPSGELEDLDMVGLAKHARDELPSYAVPIFIRIVPKVNVTATFKHQKVALRKDGCDVTQIKDPMFWMNPKTKCYEPFTVKEYNKIVTKQSRL